MHTANFKDIMAGKTTDIYFQRTRKVLAADRLDNTVTMEIRAKCLPGNWRWGILTGFDESIALLQKRRVTVRSIGEGALFYPDEPVLEVSGKYMDFCLDETALLGFLCQASGISTASARLRVMAWDKFLMCFGARRTHPAISPMVERSAYIGGFDGVATVMGAKLIDQPPLGTMPHSLVLIEGSTVKAFESFNAHIGRDVSRIALIDTLLDEKFEALNVASAFGKSLFAIRFDTPSSRRGNLVDIIKEVKWELAYRGYHHIKIIVSGGIGEKSIEALNEVADGYGIGTQISSAPSIDFSMDIVEIDGEPFAKRGKQSGRKNVFRCEKCLHSSITPHFVQKESCARCGGEMRSLMQTYIRNGKPVKKQRSPRQIRREVLRQLRLLQSTRED